MHAELYLIHPELVLLLATSLVLLVDVFLKQKSKSVTYVLSQLSLLATFILCLRLPVENAQTILAGHYVVDSLSQHLKLVLLGVMFVVLIYSRVYVKERDIARGEFHMLSLFSTLGMMCLVSANSLLLLYLGLELLTLPLYVLVALNRDQAACVEAGMKYFVVGALASGLLLYGISMLYGVTQTITLPEISQFIQQANGQQVGLLLFSMIFLIVGLAFKFGAVPCHMWIPDVYQGAPTNVALLIGSAPKIAAFGMAYRLLHDALMGLSDHWSIILIVLAILSLAVGNFAAIAQQNLKRMLAYSTIAHVGFILLGFLVAPKVGFTPALYYTVAYVLMVMCAFGIVILLGSKGVDKDDLNDIKGLSQRNPWLAFVMLLVMFSMTGVPPTLGFYAKFVVIKALVDAGYVWLAITGMAFSIIGAFYYLRIVWLMYFEKPDIQNSVGGPFDIRAVLSINGLIVLALGVLPAPLFQFCYQAIV